MMPCRPLSRCGHLYLVPSMCKCDYNVKSQGARLFPLCQLQFGYVNMYWRWIMGSYNGIFFFTFLITHLGWSLYSPCWTVTFVHYRDGVHIWAKVCIETLYQKCISALRITTNGLEGWVRTDDGKDRVIAHHSLPVRSMLMKVTGRGRWHDILQTTTPLHALPREVGQRHGVRVRQRRILGGRRGVESRWKRSWEEKRKGEKKGISFLSFQFEKSEPMRLWLSVYDCYSISVLMLLKTICDNKICIIRQTSYQNIKIVWWFHLSTDGRSLCNQ